MVVIVVISIVMDNRRNKLRSFEGKWSQTQERKFDTESFIRTCCDLIGCGTMLYLIVSLVEVCTSTVALHEEEWKVFLEYLWQSRDHSSMIKRRQLTMRTDRNIS